MDMDMSGMGDTGGMDMSGMGDMSMGDGVPTLSYIQKMYWAAVGAAIAFATLVNILNKITHRQRISAASRGVQEPAKPSSLVPLVIATTTAVVREVSYATLRPRTLWKVRIRAPVLGRVMAVLAELVLVLVLCFYMLDTNDQWSWEDIGYRTGFVASAQLPLIYVLSGKNNIIGILTGFGYERLNWLHRWVARILFLTVTIHMSFWFKSWARYDYILTKLQTDLITQRGFAAWSILLWIVLSSFRPARNWNYEFFVLQHIVTLAGFSAAVYLHLPNNLKMLVWIGLAFAMFDRVLRGAFMLYNNISIFHPRTKRDGFWASRATLEPLAGGFTRLTIDRPPISWKAGQHIFISCQSVVPLQSHPFTIASLPQDGKIQLVVKAQSGGTKSFYKYAESQHRLPLMGSDTTVVCTKPVAIEGPYGRIRPLRQFDSVVFLAGGVGSTFTMPLMRDLVRSWIQDHRHKDSGGWFRAPSASATRHIRFIWVVKSRDQLAWFTKELSEAAEDVAGLRKEGIDVELHASIYITCDDVFDLTEKSRIQPAGRAAPKEISVPTTSEDARAGKKNSIDVAVKPVDSNTSEASSIVKGCGPNGTCCCTTTIEDEEASPDAITQCTCNCGDEASIISDDDSSTAEEKPPPHDPLGSETTSLEKSTKGGEWLHTAISVLSGRPHPRTLIRKTLEQAGGESAVVVCGPEGLVYDVRATVVGLSDERAVHKGTGAQGIYLHTEEFGY